jgi:glycosyltransferase involved in cell wall biosynthesis
VSAEPGRVYLSGPAFHLRPGNTDWQYIQMLTRLPDFSNGLMVYRERVSWPTVAFNFRYGTNVLARGLRLPIPAKLPPGLEATLPRSDLRRSRCNVVYAYAHCPVNAFSVPLVFHAGAIDRARGLERGMSVERIDALEDQLRRLAGRATLVTANSRAALDNIAAIVPEARPKLRLLPFFLPYLRAATESSISEKFGGGGPIRMLFVGREARRKGLPEVLQAFAALDAAMPGRLDLTVISSFTDGEVPLPRMPNLRHLPELERDAIQNLMRASHLLLMPSHFEGYGWVYLEALAAGTIPVAGDAPVQREILDQGRAGILVAPDAERLRAALAGLLRDPNAMEALAHAGWRHCRDHFLPEKVAGRMRDVFAEAREIGAK